METQRYKIYADSGHSWLKVDKSELFNLKIASKITNYSYEEDGYVYLEEDCDATLFINAKKEHGIEVDGDFIYSDGDSIVRSYQHYKKPCVVLSFGSRGN